MSNRIKIEDLIQKELDRSLEEKSKLETKAVGYLTVIALVMTILVQLWIEVHKVSIDGKLRLICIIFFFFFFGLGVLLLILSSAMLLPRLVDYLRMDDLIEYYQDPSEDDDQSLISRMKECADTNEYTLQSLDRLNLFVSRGLMVLLAGFFGVSIILFVIMGV